MKNGTGSPKSTDLTAFSASNTGIRLTWQRIALWTILPLMCWLLMQIAHESGHMLAAWFTGGTVIKVDLHPLHISYTLVSPNPRAAVVCWSGPLIGSGLPVGLWLGAYWLSMRSVHYFQFFAGFCLIANGAYLGTVLIAPAGDTQELLRLGCSPHWMLLFGAITLPAGFWLWNGLGRKFGMGIDAAEISTKETFVVWGCFILFVVTELVVF